ncbi:ABC transporter substrate-binding protein [Acanthopleuribacter pedis]|uniref:ABC transporter substrate-binding protein n=1 Tax=Acanthopleuribacter pedis TaxID=442870 RepID=A0A8J7QFQ4_9BACT|nr:ABC transporter substrate-binding protein [Acanthopleuribacter pedis]MBO1321570.1 ABC transporter substrate-binding protein [Acanthopleuribacter pedis]
MSRRAHLLKNVGLVFWGCFFFSCGRPTATETQPPFDPLTAEWAEITQKSRDQTVNFAMWMGDPYINDYMRNWVVPRVKEQHGITLNLVPAQGGQIVSAIMTELEAGKKNSEYDMVWINGETFYQLRQINALFGPFTKQLPNAALIDFDNPFIGIDFQQPIDGYECPWGNVQLALIYNSERVTTPPQSRADLLAWVEKNPGRFTFDSTFTGMTLLKSWMIDIAGDPQILGGPFDEETYRQISTALWAYVRRLQPHLWRGGESFPNSLAQMHQMFANGELDFTMSNNDGEVDNKVLQGLFPETSRAYVPAYGTIQNSHYLGIIAGSPNKAAAMTVINFMISPAAQLEKQNPAVWGDGTVLDRAKLPATWSEKFASVPNRVHAPARETIQDRAHMELAPEYMIRLYEDFRREVLGE